VDVSDVMDSDAWTEALREEAGWLTAYLAQRLPPAAVEDVRQDVWLSWWNYRDRYQDRGHRRAFLRRLADRRITDWHRQSLHTHDPHPVPPADPDPVFMARELEACGVKPGTLIWRRIFKDESLKDLAEDVRLPLGTVKPRLHHEGALLRRRLQDWRRDRLGQDPSCAHFRRGVLGVQPCPRCVEERVVWEAMRARSRAYRAFQASSVTVESAFSVWFDCTVQVTRWEEGDGGYCPVGLSPVRRLQDGRGRNLASRIRTVEQGGVRFWTYALHPGDDVTLQVSQRADADQAEACGVVRPMRRTLAVRVENRYGPESDGWLVVELPIRMRVARVDPAPARIANLHGRWLVGWTNGADLPRTREIVVHWT
jgi:DNA-directed RNA polymerase specialized sigma24 family protein